MINFFNRNIVIIALLCIFIFGIFLRFYELSQIPNGFHIDEAINGVNGYFILQTGKDSNSNKFPLQTEVFGDYNPTGYSYLTILPIKLFGLNEFSTRFPGAFLGSLTILASFLLAFSIFKNKRISLVSAFLIAISPWHIVFSRSSEQTLVSLFFVVLGFSLVFLSFENRKLRFLIPGILLLSISFFMYFTPRVFVLLLFLSVFFFFSLQDKQKNKKYKNFLLGSFVFLGALAFILVFVTKGGGDRFKQVSLFGSLGTKLVMEEQIREDGVANTHVKITQLFHNKVINHLLAYVSNYVDYFSGNFLFIKGGLPIWFRVEGIGLMYLTELPFLLIGSIILVVNKNSIYKIPMFWILLAPIVAALTIDDVPNIRRSLVMLPMLEIISAFGFLYILQNRKKLLQILIVSVTGVILIFNFSYFIHQYFIHSGIHMNWYRNEGFGEMVKAVKGSYNNVDKVVVTKSNGGIYPLILFYMQYDPKDYLSEGSSKDKDYTGFGKFFFVPQSCPSQQKDDRFPKVAKIIYIDKGDCEDVAQSKKTIYRKDGSRVFNIVYE
ncbi:MAG: glycosyltransferase family 39 protein [Patescibacteria group bacterium]